jgi:serine/threonine protein kinase
MSQILEIFKDRERCKTEKGPIKWMAPESIRQLMFSLKTDIWAFGITMLEIWTNGNDPYPELSTREVLLKFFSDENFKPPLPPNLPSKLKEVLESCFDSNPQHRPSAEQLIEALQSELT